MARNFVLSCKYTIDVLHQQITARKDPFLGTRRLRAIALMHSGHMIKIRPLRDDDHVEWLRLRRALWPAHPPAGLEREMAQIRADLDQQPVFVAEKPDGSLCGMIEAAIRSSAEGCWTDNVGYIEGWFVDPEWRRHGVGRRLVEAAEAWARTQGCTEMASDTNPDYPISPAAHQNLGYQIVQRTIHFRKDLG